VAGGGGRGARGGRGRARPAAEDATRRAARASGVEVEDISTVWVLHISGREGKKLEPGVLLSFYLSI